MMRITAFLALVMALISAATPSPAALPQTAEIDIHLELNPKDATGSFNERKAKRDPNYHAKQTGPYLGYPFRLKGHLEYGVPHFPAPPPAPYYQFKKGSWLEQGILSRDPTIFRLENGKLVVGNHEVGLLRPFEKGPAPAILVLRGRGLNFTIDREIGGERLLLRGACIEGVCIGGTWIVGLCAGGLWVGDACTCAGGACIGAWGACGTGTCIGSACVNSVSAVERSRMHSQSFRILEVGGARLKI